MGSPATHRAEYRDVEETVVHDRGVKRIVSQYRSVYLCTEHAQADLVGDDVPRHLEILAHAQDALDKERRATARRVNGAWRDAFDELFPGVK